MNNCASPREKKCAMPEYKDRYIRIYSLIFIADFIITGGDYINADGDYIISDAVFKNAAAD